MDQFFIGKPVVSSRPPTVEEDAAWQRFVLEHISLSCQPPRTVTTPQDAAPTVFYHQGVSWVMGDI